MAKFRAKAPREIEAVQFWPDQHPWPLDVGLPPDADYYAVWNGLHGSWIAIQPGDWVNVTDEGDTYPIAQQVFAERYEPVD